jgi:hypothetical protein
MHIHVFQRLPLLRTAIKTLYVCVFSRMRATCLAKHTLVAVIAFIAFG